MKPFNLPAEVRVIDIQRVLRRRCASQNRFPRCLQFGRILVLLTPNAEPGFLLVLDNVIRNVFGGEVVSRACTIKIACAVASMCGAFSGLALDGGRPRMVSDEELLEIETGKLNLSRGWRLTR